MAKVIREHETKLAQLRAEVEEAKPWMWFFRDQMTFGEIATRTGKSLYAFTQPFTKACRIVINGDKDEELTALRAENERLREWSRSAFNVINEGVMLMPSVKVCQWEGVRGVLEMFPAAPTEPSPPEQL